MRNTWSLTEHASTFPVRVSVKLWNIERIAGRISLRPRGELNQAVDRRAPSLRKIREQVRHDRDRRIVLPVDERRLFDSEVVGQAEQERER